jgi:AraC-like DNA-binding protein
MLYFTSDARIPIEYVSSGNLISDGEFVHPRRVIDTFVLIIVVRGCLFITQGDTPLQIGKDEFVLLCPGVLHFGHKPCEGALSYYWTHFSIHDPDCEVSDRPIRVKSAPFGTAARDNAAAILSEKYMLPEYGQLSVEKRSRLLFVQLLDFAKRDSYRKTWRCHYALSLLLLEVTSESYQTGSFTDDAIPSRLFDIIEWIRTHYDQNMSVDSLAERFAYHPTYLCKIFKQHTGFTLVQHINHTRIAVAKNLLTNRALLIHEIAAMCGFADEKYFMRTFRKLEGMTPTQYRTAFFQKKVNRN